MIQRKKRDSFLELVLLDRNDFVFRFEFHVQPVEAQNTKHTKYSRSITVHASIIKYQ